MERSLVAELGAVTNLVHGFVYFAPEATAAYRALGLAERQHYVAGRAAAMGTASPAVVTATFFNFEPHHLAGDLAGAWDVTTPERVQAARMEAAGAVLRRCAGEVEPALVERATELAGAMIERIPFEGRPLAAANRAVPEPEEPWSRLWQRITVLREWRGDAHVAALVVAPVDAIQALILHAATEQVPRAALLDTRQWSDEAWQGGVDRLVERGLVEPDESFTDRGRAFREGIEATTNRACQVMVDGVGDEAAAELFETLRPVRRALLDGGAFAALGR
jgi:hypothetical protein